MIPDNAKDYILNKCIWVPRGSEVETLESENVEVGFKFSQEIRITNDHWLCNLWPSPLNSLRLRNKRGKRVRINTICFCPLKYGK